jgi:hypothetical protein
MQQLIDELNQSQENFVAKFANALQVVQVEK